MSREARGTVLVVAAVLLIIGVGSWLGDAAANWFTAGVVLTSFGRMWVKQGQPSRRPAPTDTTDEEGTVIHQCPPGDSNVTLCCGRTPFELPLTDRMTLGDGWTCGRTTDQEGT